MKKKIFNAIPIKRNWLKIMVEMKMTIFLILVLSVGVSASSLSQNQKVNLNLKDAQILDVFKEIKEQTGLRFIYNNDKLESLDKVDINASNETVKEVLDEVFKDSKFECQFKNNVIMVVDKKILPKKQNQPKKIKFSGTVYDAKGEPIPYAAVMIKGTTLGAVTNTDGVFVLEVPEGEYDFITASSVGMVTQEIEIKSQTRFRFVLKTDIESLSEVMVTGYQSISSERAAGSFKSVKVENILEQKTADNVLSLMEGEVAGLYFNEGYDEEGSTPNIVLRGVNNLVDGGRDPNANIPLIVVDGFPINGISGGSSELQQNDVFQLLKNISPTDIESFTVLKDAAAASIWGAQAANGVIVITTKKGTKSQKPKVTFNSSVSFKAVPDITDDYRMSRDAYFELEEFYANSGRLRPPSQYNTSAVPVGEQTYYDLSKGLITQAEADAIINGLKKNDFQKEYTDLFLRNYVQQQYALSMSQGTDKYQYFTSLKYRDEANSEKGVGNQEYSALINLSTTLAKGVKFSTKLSFSKSDIKNNGAQTYESFLPYERILDDNGDYIDMNYGYHPTFVEQWMNDGRPYDYHFNLKEEFELEDNSREVRNHTFQAKLDLDIIKGLKAELVYNYQHGRSTLEEFVSEKAYPLRRHINNSAIYAPIDPSRPWAGVEYTGETYFPQGNSLNGSSSANWSNGYRGVLNYSGYLDAEKQHFITAIAGMEYSEVKFEKRKFEELLGYDPQALSYVTFNKVGEYINWQGRTNRALYSSDFADVDKDKDRYLSTFTNAAYTYKEKYTLTGSWRLDDSNLFGSSSKYRNVPLWSAGFKWRMGKENFMDMPFLNRLDLRASYGIGGRIDRSSSPFLTVSKWNDRYTNLPFARVRTFENQELRWEKTTTFNAGIDFALFQNRLSGSFEYYSRYSDDVMGPLDVNPTFGVRTMGMNYAEISNKGVELTLNYNVMSTKDLKWDMNLLMSHNKNKVEEYSGDAENVAFWAGYGTIQEGYSLTKMFAYKWAGLSETGSAQVYDKDGNIVGINDDELTKEDLEFIGDATPKFNGSFRNMLRYKGFSLDVLLRYKLGHKFFRNTFRSTAATYGPRYDGVAHEDGELRWREPGDEAFTDVPALTTGYSSNASQFERNSNHLVEDASHIRISSVGLNYRFNKKLFENNFIEGISVGVNARNLGILWKATDKDIDPDFRNWATTLKSGREIYSFNLKVNF